MSGLDTKSLIIGLLVGYIVLPRLVTAVTSKAGK